jgi:hypothetical protein
MGLRKKDPAEMDRLVERTKTALLRAVDQLVTDFKVYSVDFLPYEALLIILTYILANNPRLDAEQLRRVRQWFWRSSFAERYRGASEAFISRDLEGIHSFVMTGGDPASYGQIPSEATLRRVIFRKNNSRSAAFVLAMAKYGPRNITNGAPVDTAQALSVYNKKQFHHIYPEAFLKRTRPEVERSQLLNFCILAAAENGKVSDSDPNVYIRHYVDELGADADAVYRSNLMPEPSNFDYSKATLEDFVAARSFMVLKAVEELADGRW